MAAALEEENEKRRAKGKRPIGAHPGNARQWFYARTEPEGWTRPDLICTKCEKNKEQGLFCTGYNTKLPQRLK